ncbi:MAG: SigB/SigF/SigG family RNA polymerase sigma factor [Firmicutes bacterium]|nr:SigB/SigF/SigG family RNA polymerase sigma factor [Bacillota bacterium]
MGEAHLTPPARLRNETVPLAELLARAQAGDQNARDQVVEANLRLVRSIAGRFLSSGQEPEDLFQIGCLGLLKAVDRFDLSLGLQFSTYAVPLIIGEIRRHLRDSGSIKVSRDLKHLAWEGRRKQEELAKSLGRDPTVAEVAGALSVPVERLVEAMDGAAPPASIHEVIHQKDGSPVFLLDSLSADPKGEGDPPWFERLAVRQALERLDPREREILRLRFFHDLSQTQVSSRLGVSQVHISRLERRALGQLRQYLGSP